MAAYYNQNTVIFLNGEFVNAAEARVDLYNQSMHYGFGVFEGIRSYKTAAGATRIFKAEQHFERLRQSAAYLNLPYHWSNEELIAATYEVLQRNGLQDAYIRPLVYAPPNMSFNPNEVSYIAILAWEMAPFLGDKLLRVMTSTYQRPNPKAFHMPAKACGHYVNSIMASQQAKANGFDEALLCDSNGHIAEAPGANFFLELQGKLVTPSLGHILPGITRATVFELCQQLDIKVEERPILPAELADGDSAFFCGTAAEVIGIASIDDKVFPQAWEESLGAKIQKAYKALVVENPIYQLATTAE